MVLAELRDIGMPEARMPRETALARNLAPWVVAFERRRREGRPALLVEQSGRYQFAAPGGAFTLTARADRIEVRDEGVAAELAEAALAGLVRRVARFDDETKGYASRAATQFMHEPGDYDPLARVWEWAVIGEAEL